MIFRYYFFIVFLPTLQYDVVVKEMLYNNTYLLAKGGEKIAFRKRFIKY